MEHFAGLDVSVIASPTLSTSRARELVPSDVTIADRLRR
jgi:hypothetical protein